MRKILIKIVIPVLMAVNIYGANNPLYSMFSDNKARNLNDLITIVVSESAIASNSTSNESDVSNSTNFSSGPGTGGWAKMFAPFGTQAAWDNSYSGGGKTSKSGSFQTTITAKIVEIRENGNFVLDGSKKLMINGEEELINISGEVRPADVGADNVVYSSKLYNAELSYKGAGSMTNSAKPGILTRIINWIF